MKAIPSIAFNDFSGSAGDVTARSVGGRTLINHKAYQSKVKTPAQAVSRNALSKVSRAYKQLTDSQMKAWGALAKHLKGISIFGKAAELTAHNAFVRINVNRQMAGEDLLVDAPDYVNNSPAVSYDDFWVTPRHIVFAQLNTPSDHHVLVFKMSPALSNGISSGWGRTVIVDPGAVPEWDEVDATQRYADVIGFSPEYGKKYFCEFWWLDRQTGFTGEPVLVSTVCKDGSIVHNKPYMEMLKFSIEDTSAEYKRKFQEFSLVFSGDTGLACLEANFSNMSYWSYMGFDTLMEQNPGVRGRGYMCMRSDQDGNYRCAMMVINSYISEKGASYEFSIYTDFAAGESLSNGTVFGTVAMSHS